MSDISITAANVLPGTDAYWETGTFGAAVTAGQVVYKLSTDNKFYPAECDTLAKIDAFGIALVGGSAGQPAVIQKRGSITIGGTVVVGTIYCLSATLGGICPNADLASTNYVTVIGVGISATVIQLALNTTGIAKAA